MKAAMRIDEGLIQKIILRENKFITDLFSILPPPTNNVQEEELEDKQNVTKENWPQTVKAQRAHSIIELQQRLEAMKSKKKLSYKEKLVKKGLKNRMKKKHKQHEKNALRKGAKPTDTSAENNIETEASVKPIVPKPVYNVEDKMVFSKIDFANVGNSKKKSEGSDPKKILTKIIKHKEKLAKLHEAGETEKVAEVAEKEAWKKALAKAQGLKVKDDPELLKKSIKRKEQQKRASAKKWEARKAGVDKAKEERQKKRTENIEKRKKDKKMKKMKTAIKKGKVIPGF